MRLKSHTLALAAVLAAGVISPAVAPADPGGSETHRAHGANCYTDYSRNSVDGGYCVVAPATAQSSGYGEVGLTSVPKAASTMVAKQEDAFSWGDAGVGAGAGAALTLVTVGAGAVIVARRRRETVSPVGRPSATTG